MARKAKSNKLGTKPHKLGRKLGRVLAELQKKYESGEPKAKQVE
jgi:hypothetical protein